MSKSTYIFSGGGSGGHLFPGIAVARELLDRHPAADVLFVGSDRDVEQQILAAEQLEHVALSTASSAELVRNPFQFLRRNWTAFRAARRLITSRTPTAVVGLGGFASVPVVMAAQHAGLPTLLLEQNVSPGRATRWLAGRATRVCLSFPETASQLPHLANCVVTGNPIRREIAALHDDSTGGSRSATPQLLILGGSQGARSLNRIVMESLPQLSEGLAGWRIVHQTGEADAAAVDDHYARTRLSVEVRPFIENLNILYREVDAVVSRAGATTLAELVCCGLSSILVPFPHAARDHQTDNAAWYADRGAALQIRESGEVVNSARMLSDALTALLHDGQLRRRMSERCRTAARPRAAHDVTQQLLEVSHKAAA